MSVLDLEFTSKYKRARRKKTQDMRNSIDEYVKLLSENPRHPGLHTHRVHGRKGVCQAYIDDANRVTFQYRENSIILRNNCTHDMPKQSP